MEESDIPDALVITFSGDSDPVFGRARMSHCHCMRGSAHDAVARRFTALKALGDGDFGTVYLCDWHSDCSFASGLPVSSDGLRSRPEYQGMRVVAVKRMKQEWRGDEEDWRRLQEAQVGPRSSEDPESVPTLTLCIGATQAIEPPQHRTIARRFRRHGRAQALSRQRGFGGASSSADQVSQQSTIREWFTGFYNSPAT